MGGAYVGNWGIVLQTSARPRTSSTSAGMSAVLPPCHVAINPTKPTCLSETARHKNSEPNFRKGWKAVIRLGRLNDANVVKVMCAPGMTLEIGDNYVPAHQIKS